MTDAPHGLFARPFGFSGQATMEEYRPKALTAMTLTYVPLITTMVIDDVKTAPITYIVAVGVLLFALLYQLVWFIPLMVRRGRTAGIHWAFSVVLALLFTLIYAIVLAFLPDARNGQDTPQGHTHDDSLASSISTGTESRTP